MTRPVLWHIEASMFSEKARWTLAWKRCAHRRRAPLPGTHRAIALALTRGRHDRFPVLVLADGRAVGDSTAIVAALDEAMPERPLVPADPARRARALALEDFFDEHAGPPTRRLLWAYGVEDPDLAVDMLLPRASERRRRTLRALAPVAGPVLRHDYGLGDGAADAARADVHAAMDRLEAELGDGDHLVGDGFTVADLAAASLFTPLLCPPGREYPPRVVPAPAREVRAELEARPGGQWVHATYARYR